MRIKTYLTLSFQRTRLHLKSLGLLFWVPLVVMDGIIPVLNWINYRKNGVSEELFNSILTYTQMLLPFFSVWWVLFLLREYVESDGNELLYVCTSRNKAGEMAWPFGLFLLNMAVLFAVYTLWFPTMGLEYLRIVCVCFWFLGLTFFLVFLTKSITIALMALVLYLLANIAIPMERVFFPFYYTTVSAAPSLFFKIYLPLAGSGIFFLALGMLLNQKKLKFL